MKKRRGVEVDLGQFTARVDEATDQPVLAISPLCGGSTRSDEQLEAQFADIQANSIEELCRKADVTISGTYEGPDGNERTLSVPVINESTFTPSGLTTQDAELLQMYITTRVAERIIDMPAKDTSGRLTEEQVTQLNADIEQLERSLKGGQ